METLWQTAFFSFSKQPYLECSWKKQEWISHIVTPWGVPDLCAIRHLKPSISIPKVKNLTISHLNCPLVPPRILWARVRGGLQVTGLLISVFSIISQTIKAHLPHPAFWYLGKEYWPQDLVLVTIRHHWVLAILQSPLLNSRKLANHWKFWYWYHQELEKKESYSVLSYKLSTGAENVCGLCEGFFLQEQEREDQIPCIKHRRQSQNSRSQTQF